MKKLLLSTVLFVCSFQSFTQDTLANMLEVGNKWTRFYSNSKYFGYNVSGEVTKDTIIQGLKFVVVNEMYVPSPYLSSYPNIYNKLILRQYENSVYSFSNGTIEKIYQFRGLNTGDTIRTYKSIIQSFGENQNDSILKIINIDIIKVGQASIRRFYLGSKQGAELYFFEGIGFTCAGPLNTLPASWIDGTTNALYCFKNKDGNFHTKEAMNIDTLYNGTSTDCIDIKLKESDKYLTAQITLSQLTENELQLNTELSLSNAQISIHDTKGSRYNCSIQQNNLVDIAALPAGLYILKLQTADQNLASFKFIKN